MCQMSMQVKYYAKSKCCCIQKKCPLTRPIFCVFLWLTGAKFKHHSASSLQTRAKVGGFKMPSLTRNISQLFPPYKYHKNTYVNKKGKYNIEGAFSYNVPYIFPK